MSEDKEKELSELYQKIKEVNDVLDKYGEKAIQSTSAKGYEQKGYGPQYIIEATAGVFGPANVKFKEHRDSLYVQTPSQDQSGQVCMRVIVGLRVGEDSDWVYRSARGGKKWDSKKTRAAVMNGAKSSAIKKALGRFNIGTKAYKGEL